MDIEDPVIVRIAGRLGVHPGLVCVKWAVQRGQMPIPFSVKRPQYLSSLKAVTGEPLTEQDMRDIASDRQELPPDQGPGLPVEGRSELGRPVGRERRDHPSLNDR